MPFHPFAFLLELPRRGWPGVLAWALARGLPIWTAAAAATAALLAATLLGTLLLRSCALGTVTWRNRAASWLLPFGGLLGAGSLRQFAGSSFLGSVAIAGVVLLATANDAAQPVPVWLLLAWLVDVLCLMHLVPTRLRHFTMGSRGARSLHRMIAFVVLQLAVSVPLHLQGSTFAATLVAGGPQLVVAVGYGLFVLVLVAFGRNMRWN